MPKDCTRCEKPYPLAAFIDESGNERVQCPHCRELGRARSKRFYKRNAKLVSSKVRKYRRRDPLAHRIRKRAQNSRYRAKYPEKRAKKQKAYRAGRRGRMLALNLSRREYIKRASFPGNEEAIAKIYEKAARLRADGHKIDVHHIVPLKAIDPITRQHVACGLHVPWNLGIRSKAFNLKQSNKLS